MTNSAGVLLLMVVVGSGPWMSAYGRTENMNKQEQKKATPAWGTAISAVAGAVFCVLIATAFKYFVVFTKFINSQKRLEARRDKRRASIRLLDETEAKMAVERVGKYAPPPVRRNVRKNSPTPTEKTEQDAAEKTSNGESTQPSKSTESQTQSQTRSHGQTQTRSQAQTQTRTQAQTQNQTDTQTHTQTQNQTRKSTHGRADSKLASKISKTTTETAKPSTANVHF